MKENCGNILKGEEYIIQRRQDGRLCVERQSGEICTCTNFWELIGESKPTIMNQLTSMLKRLLDPDGQALYEAGFINGDLKLTESGKEELNNIIFDANKAALVQVAKEKIAEAKAQK